MRFTLGLCGTLAACAFAASFAAAPAATARVRPVLPQ